jgi:hypothetical protein
MNRNWVGMFDVFRAAETRRVDLLFAGLWLFVAFVSVHDAYLAVLHRSTLADFELNPLGQQLLKLGSGVWGLVLAKSTGTILACALMLVLFRINQRYAWAAVLILAAFQLWLLAYLSIDWVAVRHQLGLPTP